MDRLAGRAAGAVGDTLCIRNIVRKVLLCRALKLPLGKKLDLRMQYRKRVCDNGVFVGEHIGIGGNVLFAMQQQLCQSCSLNLFGIGVLRKLQVT